MVLQWLHTLKAGSFCPSLFVIVSCVFHRPPRSRWISWISVIVRLSSNFLGAVRFSGGCDGGFAAFTKYPFWVVVSPVFTCPISVPFMMKLYVVDALPLWAVCRCVHSVCSCCLDPSCLIVMLYVGGMPSIVCMLFLGARFSPGVGRSGCDSGRCSCCGKVRISVKSSIPFTIGKRSGNCASACSRLM